MQTIDQTIQSKQKQSTIGPDWYNQSDIISNKVIAIKAIQSAIRSKQLKRYDQQYNQDQPGGGYIVNNIYAKTIDPSKKPDIQEVDVGRKIAEKFPIASVSF